MVLTVLQEGKKASCCDDWLYHCGAECCKCFVLTFPDNNIDLSREYITVKKVLTKDQVLYYSLHNCVYKRGELYIPFYNHKFNPETHQLTIYNRCKGLTESLQCIYHGTKGQPVVCGKPNIDCCSDIPGVIVTPNCLFKYKAELQRK